MDQGIVSANGGAPNHHSCCGGSSRAFAVVASVARTAVLSVASVRSDRQLVHANLATTATRREEPRSKMMEMGSCRYQAPRPRSPRASATDAVSMPTRCDATAYTPDLFVAWISQCIHPHLVEAGSAPADPRNAQSEQHWELTRFRGHPTRPNSGAAVTGGWLQWHRRRPRVRT